MYVISTSRSGGTVFCLNKAFELGIEYGGELNPVMINNGFEDDLNNPYVNYKRLFHETGIQPDLTAQLYNDAVANLKSSNKIYLLPVKLHTTALADADYYLTRKQIMNVFYSFVNYMIKLGALSKIAQRSDAVGFAVRMCDLELKALVIMLNYCKQNNKQITWYEDHYTRNTDYSDFNEWPGKQEFLNLFVPRVEASYLSSLYPEIVI